MPKTSDALRPSWRLLRALRLTHPFPTLMNGLAVGVLGLIAGGAGVRIGWLVAAMLAVQACIGIVNDLRDLDLDRLSRADKPLVNGSVSRGFARFMAAGCFAVAVLLSAGFGLVPFLLAMAGLACGLVYDLWLKRISLSFLPYALAIPLLPIWVWASLGRFHPALLIILPLGWLLGFTLHLANALPDFESDAVEGVEGLAQRIGKTQAIALCWCCYALTVILALLTERLMGAQSGLLRSACGLAALALAASIVAFVWRRSTASLRAGWVLLVLGAAVLAAGWLAALS